MDLISAIQKNKIDSDATYSKSSKQSLDYMLSKYKIGGGRIDFIDLAKGFAILLVVLGHIVQHNINSTISKPIFNFIYSFHMPLFFILSGMVASLSKDGYTVQYTWGFIRKRFVQLALPFFIWGLIITPIIVYQINDIHAYKKIAIDLLRYPDTGLWFLIVLFCIQIYFFAACLIGNILKRIHIKMGDIIGMLVVLSVLAIVTKYLGTSQYLSLQYTIMFFIGTLLLKFRILDNKLMNTILFLIFGIIVPYYNFTSSSTIFRVFIALFASLPIMHICKLIVEAQERKYPFLYKSFLNFGKHSLEIYATHICIILGFSQRIEIKCLNPMALFLLLFIIAFFLCYLITILSSILCKNKYIALLLYGKQ